MSDTVTVKSLLKMKAEKRKISVITAYDFPFAEIADAAGVHILLVGDSVGMAVAGNPTTLGVTMDQMIYHTRIVASAAKHAMVIGDMPFLSYQVSVEAAIANAGRFLKEGNAAAVKLEGGATVSNTIRAITSAGIPVQAHIGLTPQSIHQMGGYRVQRDEEKLIADAREVEAAGAFSIVLEGIPAPLSEKITQSVNIPTIGIGAGPDCDGQVLVLHDALGITQRHVPKFVKRYADLGEIATRAIETYVREVSEGVFPSKEHCY